MVFLEERTHLGLEIPLAVMLFLPLDVEDEGTGIGRADGECAVSALPGEVHDALLLQPFRRIGFDRLEQFRKTDRWVETNGEMNVVGHSVDAEAVASAVAYDRGEVCVQGRADGTVEQWSAIFRAEDDMDQEEAQGLGHGGDYKSGLQPSGSCGGGAPGALPQAGIRRAFSACSEVVA